MSRLIAVFLATGVALGAFDAWQRISLDAEFAAVKGGSDWSEMRSAKCNFIVSCELCTETSGDPIYPYYNCADKSVSGECAKPHANCCKSWAKGDYECGDCFKCKKDDCNSGCVGTTVKAKIGPPCQQGNLVNGNCEY